MKEHRKIVIEGPIGAGKTTLAKKIAFKMQADILLEPVDDNPFIHDFYQNDDKKAFATQMYFLLHRHQQLVDWFKQTEDAFDRCLIMDYLNEKHDIFAQMTLDKHELELYHDVVKRINLETFKPDLVIYLQASPQVTWQRVQKRALNFESTVTLGYLKKLNDKFADYFHHYKAAPILVVNTDGINIADHEEDFNMLMSYIKKIKKGRHYFNPITKGN